MGAAPDDAAKPAGNRVRHQPGFGEAVCGGCGREGCLDAQIGGRVLALFEDQQPHGVHAATVTIGGDIGGPGFEPAAIARRYLELLHQPPGQWTAEILHSGDTSAP